MNIITTPIYEGDHSCSICLDNFKDSDCIYLIKHWNQTTKKSEKINLARSRRHIFHTHCLNENMRINDNHNYEHLCPLDRDPINQLIEIKYSDIVNLNILNFSHNFYELLDKCRNKDISNVSVVDYINLNCKDNNGKTLLYCACQRGDLKLVKQLIKLGGNPTLTDDNGFSPLMAAATHNFINIVKYLIKIPSVIETINQTDVHNRTIFEYVMDYQRYSCLYELLSVTSISSEILNLLHQKYECLPRQKYVGFEMIIQKIKNRLHKSLNVKPTSPLIKPTPMLIFNLEHSNTI